jgi:hypothetical protein
VLDENTYVNTRERKKDKILLHYFQLLTKEG